MNLKTESENLAGRLHSLYRIYGCENDLPAHEELTAKLESAGAEVRRSFQHELSKDQVYPLSLEEALEYVSPSKRFLEFYGTVFFALPILGPSVITLAFKESFLKPKTEKAQGLMKSYNYDARKTFEQFKLEVRYEIDEDFREKVESGLYNPNG